MILDDGCDANMLTLCQKQGHSDNTAHTVQEYSTKETNFQMLTTPGANFSYKIHQYTTGKNIESGENILQTMDSNA